MSHFSIGRAYAVARHHARRICRYGGPSIVPILLPSEGTVKRQIHGTRRRQPSRQRTTRRNPALTAARALQCGGQPPRIFPEGGPHNTVPPLRQPRSLLHGGQDQAIAAFDTIGIRRAGEWANAATSRPARRPAPARRRCAASVVHPRPRTPPPSPTTPE